MKRGDVYRVGFDPEAPSGEVAGDRPAILVSADDLNRRLRTVIVIPTSASDYERQRKFRHNVAISRAENPCFDRDCVAQVHLIRHVAKERLVELRGRVSEDVLDDISVTMGLVLESRNPLEF